MGVKPAGPVRRMKKITSMTERDLVDEVMSAFPATIAVFLHCDTGCVGWLMGTFHTVADAADDEAGDQARDDDAARRPARLPRGAQLTPVGGDDTLLRLERGLGLVDLLHQLAE